MYITHLNFAKGFRGGERQTQLLIEELSKAGYHQKLLLRKGSPLKQRCAAIQNLTIEEITKPYILHLSHLKGSSLLHAHETKAAQFAYFAHLFMKIPYIITRRVDNPIKNNFFNKSIYSHAYKVVALSHAIEKEIKKVVPDAHTVIIPSAYNATALNHENIRTIKEQYPNKFIIGHVGALDDKHKGQSISINIAKRVQSYKDIIFVFVGGGADEIKLKEQAKGLDNIHFVGFVDNVNDYIATFDLFLFPSRNEGLGSTLLDVIAQEVPILASNVGGIPDIITDGIDGELFDHHNTREIEQKLLTLYQNAEKRKQLAHNAKKQLHRFSKEQMMQSYLTLYEGIQ